MNTHPTDRLSEYIDGELTASERGEIEAHLVSCAECSRLVDDLRAVVAAARGVGEEPPTWDLWPGIARRLEARRPEPHVVSIESRRRAPRRFSFSIPQLAAASLAVALLSAAAVWMTIREGGTPLGPSPVTSPAGSGAPVTEVSDTEDSVPPGVAEYEAAIADLERLLDQAGIDPETREAIDENLAVIDQAIRQTRRALEEDPNDVYLNTHLASTMQRKIDVLQGAARLARAST